MSHTGRSRSIDLRNPNYPVVSGPGGPEFQINDWLNYPESLKTVAPLFGDDDYLYFDARDVWYYRITRSDLSKGGITLEHFLEPIHDVLTKDSHFQNLQSNEPGILRRVATLKERIAERMDSPKRIGDLLH